MNQTQSNLKNVVMLEAIGGPFDGEFFDIDITSPYFEIKLDFIPGTVDTPPSVVYRVLGHNWGFPPRLIFQYREGYPDLEKYYLSTARRIQKERIEIEIKRVCQEIFSLDQFLISCSPKEPGLEIELLKLKKKHGELMDIYQKLDYKGLSK